MTRQTKATTTPVLCERKFQRSTRVPACVRQQPVISVVGRLLQLAGEVWGVRQGVLWTRWRSFREDEPLRTERRLSVRGGLGERERVSLGYLNKNDPLWQTLHSVIADEGLLLYDVERQGDGLLRVTITKQMPTTPGAELTQQEGGAAGEQNRELSSNRVTSGECTKICRRLMVLFFAEGPKFGLRGDAQIEVSSPGVNRQLRLAEHFTGAIGERVKVVATQDGAAEGGNGGTGSLSRSVMGALESFCDNTLNVLDEETGQSVSIPLSGVKRARVDFKF